MNVIFIDGKNALYRYGWVHRNLTAEDGTSTGALFGILRCMLRLKRKYPNSRFVMAWDGPGKGWRYELYPDYKSNRRKEKTEEIKAILAQKPLIMTAMHVLGVPFIEVEKVEADDLIGALALESQKLSFNPVVYSSDRDFIQLMTRGVYIISDRDKDNKLKVETEKSVIAHFGVGPSDVLALRSLCGDSSDAIPGVLPRLGPKTALKYLKSGVKPPYHQDFETFELYPELKKVWPNVVRNYRLLEMWTADPLIRPSVTNFSKTITTCRPKPYRGLIRMLCALDMIELLEERHELWNLQTKGTK